MENEAHPGVNGPTTFISLYPYFDMIKEGFVPDYIHSVLLGLPRQFVCLWINTKGCVYSLPKKSITILNDRIQNKIKNH